MCFYLPLRSFEISAHLFPWTLWAWKIIVSSSSVHVFLLISGSKWLCHLMVKKVCYCFNKKIWLLKVNWKTTEILTKISYLSLHCFPDLPLSWKSSSIFWETTVHFLTPYFFTSSEIAWSSCINGVKLS